MSTDVFVDAEAWRPNPREFIQGKVIEVTGNDAGFGRYPVVTIELDDGFQGRLKDGTFAEDVVAWHAFHDVAQSECEDKDVQVGVHVAVLFRGRVEKDDGGFYNGWKVRRLDGEAGHYDYGTNGRSGPEGTSELHAPLPEKPEQESEPGGSDTPFESEGGGTVHEGAVLRAAAPGGGLPMSFDNVPAELRERPQWVGWVAHERDGKATKVPVVAGEAPTGLASVSDPSTWREFETAVAALKWADGIGYVFAPSDDYCGIDLDDCISDGELHPAALEVVEELGGYAEFSPSGRGVHVVVRANLNGHDRNRTKDTQWGGMLEAYASNRYFTVTGRKLP